jgi:hypothetical protein
MTQGAMDYRKRYAELTKDKAQEAAAERHCAVEFDGKI